MIQRLPPADVIEAARHAAMQSPCVKSKRGVALFNRHAASHYESYPRMLDLNEVIQGVGFNGQPGGFSCNGSVGCHEHCAKLCLHAEQRAIMDAIARWSRPPRADIVRASELVHVKVVDGQVVPGGGPSCWQCSRLVVEVGLRGVWLYQLDMGIAYPFGELPGRWRFYEAAEFHRVTLRACGIEATP